MTKALMVRLQTLFKSARRQGPDSTGYLHWIEQIDVEQAIYEYDKECWRDRQVKYMIDPQPYVEAVKTTGTVIPLHKKKVKCG